jgi:hypothetical protein
MSGNPTYQAAMIDWPRVSTLQMKLFKRRNPRTAVEVAGIIERFLDGNSLYPQEWNDFVDCTERDASLEIYRKRCYELDPLVNCPVPQDPQAVAELSSMAEALRRRRTAD